jgi:hypothetical protein
MVVFLCAHNFFFVDKAFKVFYEELLCEKKNEEIVFVLAFFYYKTEN